MKPISNSHQKFIQLVAGGDKSIPKRGYYVYAITENGNICYVGKGKNYRVISHFSNSSNQLLAAKIRENKDIFDWVVLKSFDDEKECIQCERNLIFDCKKNNILLYNKIHFASDLRYNNLIGGIFKIISQYEKMVFQKINDPLILKTHEVLNVFSNLISQVCAKLKTIPTYKNKPINELRFISSEENGFIKITVQ